MKIWTDTIVKTVIIIVNFSRGGHEGDWVLLLLAAEAMLSYFRSAGCHNYARYAAFYVHRMKGLDPVMLKTFQYGLFVRRTPDIYNSTWMDIFIETTYMRLWPQTTIRSSEVDPWLCLLRGGIAEYSIFEQH